MSFLLVCSSRNYLLFLPLIYILARLNMETTVPADILLVNGTCIVNEAMLSGESTPLLKESIQLLEPSENLDVDGAHKNAVLFSGTKILQASKSCNFLYLRFFHFLIIHLFS
jgi:P-type E1-E2 ATPase